MPLAGQAAEDNKSQLKDIQQSIAEKKAVKQQQQQRSSLQDQLRQQEKPSPGQPPAARHRARSPSWARTLPA
ncbi:hypothetical protein M8494_31875 [Serratia ureilytica]